MRRWEQQALVQSLRRQGFSYREILSQLPFRLSRGTLSAWCKDIVLTPAQLDRLDRLYRQGSYRGRLLGPKATQQRRAAEVEAIKAQARTEADQRRYDELWLAGLMLYWAEGNKTHQVGLANSDPGVMRLAMKWFRERCHVPEHKFRAYLNIHSGQHDNTVKDFWSSVIQLPVTQFGKSYVKQEGTGHRKNTLYYGTVRINICNTDLLHRILGWIEGYSQLVCGPLAQLVEQLPLKQRAAGSTPARPTSFS